MDFISFYSVAFDSHMNKDTITIFDDHALDGINLYPDKKLAYIKYNEHLY